MVQRLRIAAVQLQCNRSWPASVKKSLCWMCSVLPVFPPIDMGFATAWWPEVSSSSFICDPKHWMDRGRLVVSVVVVCVGVSARTQMPCRTAFRRVHSAEWGWSVSALMPSRVEARVDGHVGAPRLRPHRRVVRMTVVQSIATVSVSVL